MKVMNDPITCALELPQAEIAQLCRRYGVEELAVFGSVLREGFHAESDIDFLVQFKNNDAGPWMSKFMDMEIELGELLGRTIDLVDRRAIEQSDNYIRREQILGSAKTIYAAK